MMEGLITRALIMLRRGLCEVETEEGRFIVDPQEEGTLIEVLREGVRDNG
jgi:hypothetical protein